MDTEWYRSGHNETDSKSVVPSGTVGSNPTHSAKQNASPLGEAFCFFGGIRKAALSGMPEVAAVQSLSERFARNELYRLAASAEQLSEHPLGKAPVSSCPKDDIAAPMFCHIIHRFRCKYTMSTSCTPAS